MFSSDGKVLYKIWCYVDIHIVSMLKINRRTPMTDKTAGVSLVTVLSIALGLCAPAAASTIGISGPPYHEYAVAYGDKTPFMREYMGFVLNSGKNINMSFEFDSPPASVPDVQLVRYWTYKEWSLSEYPYPGDWRPGMLGPLVREVEVTLGDNVARNALTFRMDETQPNDMNWFVVAQFLFSPPAETGFVDPFHSAIYATETPDPAYTDGGDGMGITIIGRAGLPFNLSIVPEPSMIGLLGLGGLALLRRRRAS